MTMIHSDNINYSEMYATKIISGEIVANEMIMLAAQRYFDDIERSKTDDFDYYFNNDLANKAIKNIE